MYRCLCVWWLSRLLLNRAHIDATGEKGAQQLNSKRCILKRTMRKLTAKQCLKFFALYYKKRLITIFIANILRPIQLEVYLRNFLV